MSTRRPRRPSLAGGARRYILLGVLAILAMLPVGLLNASMPVSSSAVAGRPVETLLHGSPRVAGAPSTTPTPTPRPKPTAAPCSGPPLTSQSQVQPDRVYCGGIVHTQIQLADGDSWTGGDVSGAVTGRQQGAVQCGNPCTLINMSIHDNPGSFAGVYAPWGVPWNRVLSASMTIVGGRVSGSGSLGIGGAAISQLTISGVEIDHNGATADCQFEGGGFKGLNHGSHLFDNYVHDNNCIGIWYDINAANNEIDHNRVVNNSDGGVLYEIGQDASIHDNDVEGNGARACDWLWGAGIGVASSFNVQVYSNTVTANCNGIAGTQQNRTDSTPPAHLLANLTIHDNTLAGRGKTGVGADNGADLTTRNIGFANNTQRGGALLCRFAC